MTYSTVKLERRILEALLNNLRAAGFVPAAVWIDESYLMPGADGALVEFAHPEALDPNTEAAPELIHRPMTNEEVVQVFTDYDLATPTVHFTHQHKTSWGNRGVMVVPGNGQDFISDYHSGDPAFTAIVDSVADAAGNSAFD